MPVSELALKILVLFGINLHESNQAVLVARLREVEVLGQTALLEVEKLVVSLEEITASLTASADKAGLIQADDLKWAVGGRLSGLYDQKADIRARLTNLLNLDYFNRATGVTFPSTFKVIRG